MRFASTIVAHHGIVSGIYDDLEIGRIIDEVIPKQGQSKLAHSVVLKAMIMNARDSTRDGSISSQNFSAI